MSEKLKKHETFLTLRKSVFFQKYPNLFCFYLNDQISIEDLCQQEVMDWFINNKSMTQTVKYVHMNKARELVQGNYSFPKIPKPFLLLSQRPNIS